MLNFKIPITYKDIIESAKSILKKAAASPSVISATPSKEAVSKNSQNSSGLIGEFEAIDEKYSLSGEGLNLKKLEYDAPTNKEIQDAAKNELLSSYNEEKNNIIGSIKKTYSALEEEKGSISSDYAVQSNAIDDYYGERKKQAESDALKRGLARSSIITNKIEEFDKGKISDKTSLEQDTQKQIISLDSKINSLENEKASALGSYEISYAAELSGKIKELENERDEKLQEVTKYNNTVLEKEKEYADKTENENSIKYTQTFKQEEKLAASKKYYDTLSKEQALQEFLQDASMKTHLGTYYNYMLNYLNNRK